MSTPLKHCPCLLAVLALAAAPALAETTASGKHVYKWVDEKGEVHYGDYVPPQYADKEKTVLNGQGVSVATYPGRRTPEQLQAEAVKREAEERVTAATNRSHQRDSNLLATYLTVEEIEALRDRRADILDGQARVTNQYLEILRAKQRQLEEQTKHFKPYNTAPNAQQLPERVAEDLVRVTNDIATQQSNLEVKRHEVEALRAQFASDIERFRELKKIESDYARGAPSVRN
jgi:hypothetical protein